MASPYRVEFNALTAKFETLDAQVKKSPGEQNVTNAEMMTQFDTLNQDVQELKKSLWEQSANNTDVISQFHTLSTEFYDLKESLEEYSVKNDQKIDDLKKSVKEQNARHTEILELILQLRKDIQQLKQGTVNQGYSASPSHSTVNEGIPPDVNPMEIMEAEQLPQAESGKRF